MHHPRNTFGPRSIEHKRWTISYNIAILYVLTSTLISRKVGAVIVTYNPVVELLTKVINSLLNQVSRIVVVDNNSANFEDLKCSLVVLELIHLIENSKNLGIAEGMNQGVEFFLKTLDDWVLFLDQDSVASEHYVDILLGKLDSDYAGDRDRVVLIRGGVIYENSRNDINTTPCLSEIKGEIMSGSLVRKSIFNFIRFRSDFFMDFVETDFYYNIGQLKGICLMFNAPLLTHKLGTQFKALGRNHSYENPRRVYYMIRNSTLLTLEGKGDLGLIIAGFSPILLIMIRDGIRIATYTFLSALRDALISRERRN